MNLFDILFYGMVIFCIIFVVFYYKVLKKARIESEAIFEKEKEEKTRAKKEKWQDYFSCKEFYFKVNKEDN